MAEQKKGELSYGAADYSVLQEKLDVCLQPSPHSYSEDGLVRFGDNVQLIHDRSGGALSNDLWSEIGFGSREYMTTVGRKGAAKQAIARNVWLLVRAPAKRKAGGPPVDPSLLPAPSPLKWGEPFMLQANPALRLDKRTNMLKCAVFLSSEQQNITKKVSQVSGNQMVCCDYEAGFATTVWIAERWKKPKPADGRPPKMTKEERRMHAIALAADPRDEFVNSHEALVLRHASTNRALSAEEKYTVESQGFGPELEACCLLKTTKEMMKDPPKAHPLLPAGTATKPKRATIVWRIEKGLDAAAAVDTRNLPDRIEDPLLLIKKIREILIKRNPEFGIRAMGMKFRQADDDKSGELNAEELEEALNDMGVFLDTKQLTALIENLDTSGDGEINYNEFLVAIKGPMNQGRIALVLQAYGILDTNGDGTVTIEDIAETYDTSMHPKIINGEATHEEVIALFMEQWETDEKDGIVTKKEFITYYSDVSASIDDDQYFELMMRNAWHISGGKGQTENTSNLRVCVSFTDGRPDEVICVEKDMGLKRTDTAKIIKRLTQQGVENIKGIS